MRAKRREQNNQGGLWHFVLYLSGGETKLSKRAIENLDKICEEHLNDRYSIQTINIEKQPEIGIRKGIIASPTLIRELPEPVKRVIGNLQKRKRLWLPWKSRESLSNSVPLKTCFPILSPPSRISLSLGNPHCLSDFQPGEW